MRDLFPGVKMLTWFLHKFLGIARAFERPVDVSVDKWKEINLPFTKQQQFNGLRFCILIQRNRLIAPKKGIDNSPANL